MFQRIIDSIFNPVIDVLTAARDRLDYISMVTARGINLDYYLGPVSMLGYEWKVLITSIVTSAFLIAVVLIGRKIYGVYLALKEGVKWW